MAATATATGTAYARAGLLGNPSDGYGGKAIALPIFDFRARVVVQASDRFSIEPGESDQLTFPSLAEAARAFGQAGCEDGLRLIRAAVGRFWGHASEELERRHDEPRLRFAIRYETDIPRQVGLAGSSAIVVAAIRALASWFEIEIAPADLAELALAAEVEDLGIAAGAMDRVVQAYESLTLMDLREPRTASSYSPLDPGLLPPLFVAWDPHGAESSGIPHGDLRARWERGDAEVLEVIQELRKLVDEGMIALERRATDQLRALMKRNLELRARVFHISEQDRRMIAIAAEHGAVAKLCGSGGAVIGVPAEGGAGGGLEDAFARAGFRMIRPRTRAWDGATSGGAGGAQEPVTGAPA